MAENASKRVISPELLEELLIYGYVRRYASQFNLFSEDLLDLCIEWYHTDNYWMFVGDHCTLNHTRTTVQYKGEEMVKGKGEIPKNPNSCFHSIVMPSISETEIEYIFKMKIHKCQDILNIGLVDDSAINENAVNEDFSSKSNIEHFVYHSDGGTAWNRSNAVSDKRTYHNSGRGITFGKEYGENDIITMHFNPFKARAQLWFEKNGGSAQYGDGMNIVRKMGLQYRLAIFMGDYGQQSVELMSYERIGDEESESESDKESSSASVEVIAAADDDQSDHDQATEDSPLMERESDFVNVGNSQGQTSVTTSVVDVQQSGLDQPQPRQWTCSGCQIL